jgi:hypothetical protein
MLKRLKKPQHQKLAEQAVRETAPANGVGSFLGVRSEDSHTESYRFESKMKGYDGWEWNAVVFQTKKSSPATVSEVVLLPGEGSLVAPQWVPWSERRAEIEKTRAEDSAAADLEESEDPKADSKDTAEKPPIRKRLRKKLIRNHDADQSQDPGEGSK